VGTVRVAWPEGRWTVPTRVHLEIRFCFDVQIPAKVPRVLVSPSLVSNTLIDAVGPQPFGSFGARGRNNHVAAIRACFLPAPW
jgi:hypothetical protein